MADGGQQGERAVPGAPAEPTPARPALLLAAAGIGAGEVLALVVYVIAIGFAAAGSGTDVASAPAEIVIYLLFALGIGLVVKGLLNRRRIARGPYIVTQMFGLIVGWTLASGDGAAVHVAGWIVLVASLAGIALMLNGQVAAALQD
jgi:hypothetical protein